MSNCDIDISVRDIREADLEMIMGWRMDPDITRYMNTDPVLTMEIQRKWFKSISEDERAKFWLIEIGGQPAGMINLIDIDWEIRSSSWGYYIGEKRLRSFQTALSIEMSLYDYVFDVLLFNEIHNEAFAINAAVIKIHEFCGNKIVKVEKNEVEKDGQFYDVTHLSLTREGWYSIRNDRQYQKIDFGTGRL